MDKRQLYNVKIHLLTVHLFLFVFHFEEEIFNITLICNSFGELTSLPVQ